MEQSATTPPHRYIVIFWGISNRDKYNVRICETEMEKDSFVYECKDKGLYFIVSKHLYTDFDGNRIYKLQDEGQYPAIRRTLLLVALGFTGMLGYTLYYLLTHIKI